MNIYIIDAILPEEMSEGFLSLIPFQRARVGQLMSDRKLLGYSLAADRSKLWITLSADSREEARGILKTFPLFPWMTCTIHELAFHHTSQSLLPEISQN